MVSLSREVPAYRLSHDVWIEQTTIEALWVKQQSFNQRTQLAAKP